MKTVLNNVIKHLLDLQLFFILIAGAVSYDWFQTSSFLIKIGARLAARESSQEEGAAFRWLRQFLLFSLLRCFIFLQQ